MHGAQRSPRTILAKWLDPVQFHALMSSQTDRINAALDGRYRIERELGAGGMATVYLAEDVRHHRQVAVKVLRPDLAATLGPDRFLREIELAAQLTHPHILPLFDSGDADGVPFFVMPLVQGASVETVQAGAGATVRYGIAGDDVELVLLGISGADETGGGAGALLYRTAGESDWRETTLPPLEFRLLETL